MYAAVTTVFDVSSLLQSRKWSVEAYTAAECRYSMVMVSLVSACSFIAVRHFSTTFERSNISSSIVHLRILICISTFCNALPDIYIGSHFEHVSPTEKPNALAGISGHTDLPRYWR
jgi:hypothetical protein